MPDKKISALTSATTPLAGTEVLPIVQSGATVKVSVDDLTAGKAVSASGLTLSGGTANGVAYLNATKVVTTGTSLVFDGTNLGVGVAAPLQKLHVATAGNNYIVSHNTTGSTSALLLGAESGLNAIYSWTTVGGSTGRPLAFFTGANETMRLTTSGSVGIGTNSPGQRLHVASAGNNYIVSHNTSGSTSALLLGAESGQNTIYSWTTVGGSTGRPLSFYTGASETLRVDTGGNIYGTSGTTGMTNGFFYIPAAAGVPTGVPTAVAGRVPMYYDTTNNNFYVYNGGWKKVLLA